MSEMAGLRLMFLIFGAIDADDRRIWLREQCRLWFRDHGWYSSCTEFGGKHGSSNVLPCGKSFRQLSTRQVTNKVSSG
jgi:hypothetical protein